MPEIGETLREARTRRRIDISDAEAATKIRAKYLRALENEEWSLLPGSTFVKTFLRTYADYLGLDGKILVEEYKVRFEPVSTAELQPFKPQLGGRREPPRPRGPSRGAVVGVVIGAAGAQLLRRSALPLAGLYPLATLALCVLGYASASLAHTSGFVAVYLCGLVLGNAALPHRSAVLGFAEGTASLAQIGLFVLLGLLVSPARLPGALLPALLVGGVLLVLARPLSVLASVAWFRMPVS
jgi:hypothetical protein